MHLLRHWMKPLLRALSIFRAFIQPSVTCSPLTLAHPAWQFLPRLAQGAFFSFCTYRASGKATRTTALLDDPLFVLW